MHEALRIAERCEGDEVMVIGGESVYREMVPMACRVYLTEVNAVIEGGDAFFPLDAIRDWREAAREKPRDVCEDEYDCTFRLLQR
jgi:dihydrofolate reductase